MNEFTHYEGCKGQDLDNCSGCALEARGQRKPNYAGWPLSYMQNGIRIPPRFFDGLLEELESDNKHYAENLKKQLKEHGYDIEVLKQRQQKLVRNIKKEGS